MKRLLSLVPFVGIIGLAIATAVQLVQHGDTGFLRATLLNCITYLVGVTGIVTGCGHMFFPDPIADSSDGGGEARSSGKRVWPTSPTEYWE